jgi:hypothetical protein
MALFHQIVPHDPAPKAKPDVAQHVRGRKPPKSVAQHVAPSTAPSDRADLLQQIAELRKRIEVLEAAHSPKASGKSRAEYFRERRKRDKEKSSGATA